MDITEFNRVVDRMQHWWSDQAPLYSWDESSTIIIQRDLSSYLIIESINEFLIERGHIRTFSWDWFPATIGPTTWLAIVFKSPDINLMTEIRLKFL